MFGYEEIINFEERLMLEKIKRQDCLDKYPVFPLSWYDETKEEMNHFHPNIYNSYILTFFPKSIKGQDSKILARELVMMISKLNFNELIFLGDTNTAWLSQNNTFKPVKEALKFLIDNKVEQKFDGGLQVEMIMLPIFFEHLYWLARCNAALPNFYFTNSKQNIIGTICQYGNVHIDTLNNETDRIFKDIITKTQFKFLSDEICSRVGESVFGREEILIPKE